MPTMQFIVPWLVVKLVVPLIFGLKLVAAPQFLKQIVASPTVPGTIVTAAQVFLNILYLPVYCSVYSPTAAVQPKHPRKLNLS